MYTVCSECDNVWAASVTLAGTTTCGPVAQVVGNSGDSGFMIKAVLFMADFINMQICYLSV